MNTGNIRHFKITIAGIKFGLITFGTDYHHTDFDIQRLERYILKVCCSLLRLYRFFGEVTQSEGLYFYSLCLGGEVDMRHFPAETVLDCFIFNISLVDSQCIGVLSV